MLTRARNRDFVDLYVLLKEGHVADLGRLSDLARAKFEAGPNPITLAEQLLRVEAVTELPPLLRPVSLADLRGFFVDLARQIVRRGV